MDDLSDRPLVYRGPGRPQSACRTGQAVPGHRPVARELQVYGLACWHGARPADTGVPHQFFGRSVLRTERRIRLRPRIMGGSDGGRSGIRHHPLWNRNHARTACGKGFHHRRPRHRWLHEPDGSGHGLGRGHEEAVQLLGQTLSGPQRHGPRRPQATGGPADRRPGRRAGRRCANHGKCHSRL